LENIDVSGSDNIHLRLLKNVISAIKSSYTFTVETNSAIINEVIIFFSEAKIADKPYYFFPKNVFQISKENSFYILDCFFDYGYFAGSRGIKDNGTSRQIWGYAKTKEDYGNLVIRPITRLDKLIRRFISSGVKLKVNKEFDDKYCVASNHSKTINYLNKEFIDFAAKSNNLLVYMRKGKLLIGFLDKKISSNQVLYLCKLLNSMAFIERTI
jgi:hypothetical protein